jgi:alkylation response protein AidB-like acyl-CoA dehydrogenase
MDLRFTPEELAFRDEVRSFFHANLPDGIRGKLVEGKKLAKDDIVAWQRILNKKGWAVANWPVEWGGTGWTPVQQYMFQDELQQTPGRARAPILLRSGPRPSAMATITSSTARRPGRPWLSTPTGSFAWCAPTRGPRSRKASRFC